MAAGLGIANLVGAATNCYTTTGSFSRSAINNSTGARTREIASMLPNLLSCVSNAGGSGNKMDI